jgi:hypothetical protein
MGLSRGASRSSLFSDCLESFLGFGGMFMELCQLFTGIISAGGAGCNVPLSGALSYLTGIPIANVASIGINATLTLHLAWLHFPFLSNRAFRRLIVLLGGNERFAVSTRDAAESNHLIQTRTSLRHS